MTTTVSYVASIAEAVRTLTRGHDLDHTLARIAEVAGTSVPGFDHVGISIVTRPGEIATRAATDPLVAQLDDLQYELGEVRACRRCVSVPWSPCRMRGTTSAGRPTCREPSL
jgi:hypothetical protein